MSLRSSARYDYGLPFTRFLPHNDDGSIPVPTRIVGGIGPFDFSGAAAPAAVPIKWKIDNGAEQSDTISIVPAVDDEAVTVDELVTAFGVASITGLNCTKEAVTGRLKIVMATPGTTKTLQVYDEFAELARIGQGLGVKWIKSDTGQSLAEEPTMKADEKKTITDANGIDTSVNVPGYREGAVYTFVDTAHDDELRQLMEGGIYDATAKTYEAPTLDSEHRTFMIEAFYAAYKKGSNKKADLVGYVKQLIRSAQGNVKAGPRQADFAPYTYTITATSYKDETGAFKGDKLETELSVTDYEALSVLTA